MSKIFSKKYLVTYEVTWIKRHQTDKLNCIVNGNLEKWLDEERIKFGDNIVVLTFAIAI